MTKDSGCDFLGLTLIDLDDPVPKRAFRKAQALGMTIEEFIVIALEEKLERMGDAEG